MRVLLGLGVLASFALLACGSPEGARAPSAPAAAPAGQAAPCNAVVQQGEPVDVLTSAGTPPKPSGGIIEGGTYVLTGLTFYTSSMPGGARVGGGGKVTMEVNGATSQVVRTSAEGNEQRSTVTRVNSGTETTATTTCLSPPGRGDAPVPAGYTATSRSLVLISEGLAGTSAATYRRLEPAQPAH